MPDFGPLINNYQPMNNQPLVRGRDYYIENGYYVFTAYYLEARGYCCGSGCRHCPYKGQNEKEKKPVEKKKDELNEKKD